MTTISVGLSLIALFVVTTNLLVSHWVGADGLIDNAPIWTFSVPPVRNKATVTRDPGLTRATIVTQTRVVAKDAGKLGLRSSPLSDPRTHTGAGAEQAVDPPHLPRAA